MSASPSSSAAADKDATASHVSEKQTKPAGALSFWPLFWKSALLSLGIACVMLIITGLIVSVWAYGRFSQFLASAGVSRETLISQIKQGWESTPQTDQGRKNILLLGTDAAEERGDIPPLTDTMILVSVNTQTGTINTLPLPRDLWSDAYQTKINALYAYGRDRYPAEPERFPEEVLEELTGLPIHHTLVLSFDQLKQLIDLLGGVEITVEQGFTDPLFPRSGVNVATERDPAVLYETIAFEAGPQTLSGERALQYIRSRHSEDEQGHDLARGQRQQQVIEALLAKLMQPKLLITQPELAGSLYRFYQTDFSRSLPLPELVATAKTLLPFRKNLQLRSHQLTETDDDPVNGTLENPPLSARYQNQWVYIIADQQVFQRVIHETFFGTN